jgi:hypothetical protein
LFDEKTGSAAGNSNIWVPDGMQSPSLKMSRDRFCASQAGVNSAGSLFITMRLLVETGKNATRIT